MQPPYLAQLVVEWLTVNNYVKPFKATGMLLQHSNSTFQRCNWCLFKLVVIFKSRSFRNTTANLQKYSTKSFKMFPNQATHQHQTTSIWLGLRISCYVEINNLFFVNNVLSIACGQLTEEFHAPSLECAQRNIWNANVRKIR